MMARHSPSTSPRLVHYGTGAGGGGILDSPEADRERNQIRQRRWRILVVDDEERWRTAICARLKAVYKAVAFEAEDARGARASLGAHPDVDLVLIDVTMPETDGLTLWAQLRAAGVSCHMVVMSAIDANEERAQEVGAPFIRKPLPDPELRRVLLDLGGDA
jgi:CheY-like chemotaxis protein